eukprot:sb/3473755/
MKLLLILTLSIIISHSTAKLNGGGFGEKYNWVPWEQAKTVAKSEDKPIMLILHKSWCGACKRLKPIVSVSDEILELSQKFVMVNSEDDEAPMGDDSFSLDGGYIPRIIFLDSAGNIRPEFANVARGDKYTLVKIQNEHPVLSNEHN